MSKLSELAEKRKIQSKLAQKVVENISDLKAMSDTEVRLFNLDQQKCCLQREVKDGVPFGAVYEFAYEHCYNEKQKNVLDAIANETWGFTLLYDSAETEKLIRNRKLNEKQYACFVKAADMINSGEFEHYRSVKALREYLKE